ncbi:acyl-CoA dehydrogenase family protein [Pseudomonas entomophila]|uniref:acyl-CoA dehydrogenase family protein n=1 Tax=Pseudomonas entomophila TaxID=312306 RepID=UPI0023D83627|nr:acyl-CoA dehydrogenase family protein [Pseudomonas entomophila]MDF0732776.1 acyl-CoA dehydrogenase family protein [Pseudomonas entomophila]
MYSAEERLENIRMIRDSAAAFASAGDLLRVRGLRYQAIGFDRELWREMAENGWLGLSLPAARGGAGLGMAEYCALLEELGAGLLPEPFVPGVLAARLLDDEHLAPQLAGERLWLPALQENNASLDAVAGGTRFSAGTVSGRKVNVPMGAGADGFLVSTPEGVALVEADAPGLHIEHAQTQDGGHFATLTLERVAARLLPLDRQTLADALDEAALGTAAYLLGVAERAFALTLDYLCTRKQFGQAIGAFQALQHRAVDLKLQLALWRASLDAAASACDSGAPVAQRRAAVSRAKARAADAALLVTRQAVQMHGAIGYTDECDIGLFLRKAMTLANLYGSSASHRLRYDTCMPSLVDA